MCKNYLFISLLECSMLVRTSIFQLKNLQYNTMPEHYFCVFVIVLHFHPVNENILFGHRDSLIHEHYFCVYLSSYFIFVP
jgi:hypothetical protein